MLTLRKLIVGTLATAAGQFQPGHRSARGARFIRRVDMTYSTLPGGGTALVTLLGYKL